MVWILLNPSTADADRDDPTLRKCVGFARTHGHGGVIIVNLFAWRATDPRELHKVLDPVGPENDVHILWAIRAPILATVVAGWGGDRFAQRRATHVGVLVQGSGRHVRCVGITKNGAPKHPLYSPYTSPLEALR
jgi:hypothetical protein